MIRYYNSNIICAIILLTFISLALVGGCNNNNGKNSDDGLGAPGPDASSGDRTVTFINKCSQTVWIGVNGGNPLNQMTNCAATPTDTCPAGQACNTRSSPTQCQWILPAPDSGSFELAASGMMGDQAVFTIPASQAVDTSNQIVNVNVYG